MVTVLLYAEDQVDPFVVLNPTLYHDNIAIFHPKFPVNATREYQEVVGQQGRLVRSPRMFLVLVLVAVVALLL
jgi:hypothetical protein